MIKAFAKALSASVAVAAATSVDDIRVDVLASTKYRGVVGWQQFYQRYINQLFESDTDAPDSFDSESHLCWWQWRVEQPFEIDERYSIAVTHNCPVEHVSSITFDVTWEEVIESSAIVHDDDTDEPDAELLTGVKGVVVYAKTAAGWGVDQDFGFWHPKPDGAPSWTFSYQVNIATETPAVESSVVRLDTTYELPEAFCSNTMGVSDYFSDYTVDTGVFELDDDFVNAGTVTLTKIEGEDQYANFIIGVGCRRLTFTNGVETVNTGWLGGADRCGKSRSGFDIYPEVIMEPNFSQGFYAETQWCPDAHYKQRAIRINEHSFGAPLDYLEQITTVSATQRICGVSWYRQEYIYSGYDQQSIVILWRPTVCEGFGE